MESDVGLTPNNDGKIIRLQIPELTEERRKELVKVVRGIAEEGRVAIRNIRRDVHARPARAQDAGEAGADDEHRAEDALQKLTDEKVTRARRGAQGQGRRDPRGVSDESAAEPARYVAIITDGNGRWAGPRACRSPRATARAPTRQGAAARRRRPRGPRADRLLVLDRELVAPGRGGRRR